ncbi:MFS transporter [Nocardia sp. NPDC056000]|uniref:MFS transporter n=1 Tax=Nocardia sp. NPDC056000 TaxID=3345674 RepID=UPI0035DF1346
MLPLPLLGALAGWLTTRIGVWRTSALGLLIAAAGFAGIAVMINGNSYPLLLAFMAVWGSGLGILTPAIVAAALRAAPDSPGAASGASNTSRQTGGALGVAIFAAIAGPATGTNFTAHSAGLFIAAAAAFVVIGVLLGTNVNHRSPNSAPPLTTIPRNG